jgi:hypothetical protein
LLLFVLCRSCLLQSLVSCLVALFFCLVFLLCALESSVPGCFSLVWMLLSLVSFLVFLASRVFSLVSGRFSRASWLAGLGMSDPLSCTGVMLLVTCRTVRLSCLSYVLSRSSQISLGLSELLSKVL